MRKLFQGQNLVVLLVCFALLMISVLFIRVPLPAISLPAEKIPGLKIGNFPITNTIVATLIADVTVLLLTFFAVRKMREVPQGLQNVMEWILETFDGMLTDIGGKEKARKWLPMFMTILLFLLVANWWELIPGVDSIGMLEPVEVSHYVSGGTINIGYLKAETPILGIPTLKATKVSLSKVDQARVQQEALAAEQQGEEYHPSEDTKIGGYVLIPFVRAAATDLNVALALALISVIATQIVGMRALGLKYWRRFFNPVITGIVVIDIFVGILELISEVAKLVSFSFRLFGNVFAGQILLFVMAFLVAFLIPLPFYGLEMFVGFMQAFVFAILTFIFFEQGTHSHAGEAHH